MKIYISADMEGLTGVTHWDEVLSDKPEYARFRDQMAAEVNAACLGALAAGAEEITVKDAHGSGRNLHPGDLPDAVQLIRGWSGHPLSMIQELDDSYTALMMIGYHSRAGSGGCPLAHTMSSSRIAEVILNGRSIAEMQLFGTMAAVLGVPLVLVSGDEQLCADAAVENDAIHTVAVQRGVGNSTVSIAPDLSVDQIQREAEISLTGDLSSKLLPVADHWQMTIHYHRASLAYRARWYPGASPVGDTGIEFRTREYFEVLRLIQFVL